MLIMLTRSELAAIPNAAATVITKGVIAFEPRYAMTSTAIALDGAPR